MIKNTSQPRFMIGFTLAFLTNVGPIHAQIIPDTTLPVNSQVIPGVCTGCTVINSGTERGANLFHSFREFSIPTGGSAFFNNATQIQNILTRVTGTSISNIDGLIRANGNANLYLLNPNGIVFGPNASLDIGGSFLATTATAFKFANGSEYGAINPQTPPLLAVNVVPGVQFSARPQGSTIISAGNLATGQNLTLLANKLDLQGQLLAGRDLTLLADNAVIARDSRNTPFVAAAGGNLLLQGSQKIDIAVLKHPSSGLLSGGDLVLRSNNTIGADAHFSSGRNFSVERLDGSVGNLYSPNDPIILTNGDVTLGDYTGASLHILAGGSVTLGNVTITGIGDSATTINPGNTTLFNGSRTYADLATFNLTDYKAILNSDGSVRSVDPVAVPITIDGSKQATLDVRAGVDWTKLGGLPTNPAIVGLVSPTPVTSGSASRGDITINGSIKLNQPEGLILLTNQFISNSLLGTINIQGNVDASIKTTSNGGDIRVYGRGNIEITSTSLNKINIDSSTNTYNDIIGIEGNKNIGNGGMITISTIAGNIKLNNVYLGSGASLGNGGAISITTGKGEIKLEKSSLISGSSTRAENSGDGGNISIITNSGNIEMNSYFNSSSSSDAMSTSNGNSGNGGSILVITKVGNIQLGKKSSLNTFSNSGTLSYSAGNAGNGGNINLSARFGLISGSNSTLNSFAISNLGRLSGNGGKVILEAGREVSGITINTTASSEKSGDVQIKGFDNLLISDITIFNSQTLEIPRYTNASITSKVNVKGQAGNLIINSVGDLIFNKSLIKSDSLTGNSAGNISITSPGIINFINSQITSNTFDVGKAGDININASVIQLNANSQIKAETIKGSSGKGGNIILNGPNAVELIRAADGIPAISVESSGAGKAGDITINTPKLTLSDAAKITATATKDSSNLEGGGSVTLNASNIDLAGGTVGVFAETDGITPAGKLNLNPYSGQSTLNVHFTPGSVISASTSSSGRGGDLSLTAPQSIILDGPGKLSVETKGIGDAGNIFVSTQNLTLRNGVKLLANTSGSGKGGNIEVTANTVNLNQQSQIAVNGDGKGNGGDITITAPSRITLDNQSAITATTSSGNGGNITIDPDILLLRNNSRISTSAGKNNGGGDGGNIIIAAGFLVGVLSENSDITANAYTGSGGRITINTNGIFGFIKAPSGILDTPFSDIAASSQLGINGAVILNTFNVDPSQGLAELNLGPIDSSKLIAQGCSTGKRFVLNENKFVTRGRSGIPASPSDVFRSGQILTELGTPTSVNSVASIPVETVSPPRSSPNSIIEAQGWRIAPNGKIRLVTESNSPVSSSIPPPSSPSCPQS